MFTKHDVKTFTPWGAPIAYKDESTWKKPDQSEEERGNLFYPNTLTVNGMVWTKQSGQNTIVYMPPGTHIHSYHVTFSNGSQPNTLKYHETDPTSKGVPDKDSVYDLKTANVTDLQKNSVDAHELANELVKYNKNRYIKMFGPSYEDDYKKGANDQNKMGGKIYDDPRRNPQIKDANMRTMGFFAKSMPDGLLATKKISSQSPSTNIGNNPSPGATLQTPHPQSNVVNPQSGNQSQSQQQNQQPIPESTPVQNQQPETVSAGGNDQVNSSEKIQKERLSEIQKQFVQSQQTSGDADDKQSKNISELVGKFNEGSPQPDPLLFYSDKTETEFEKAKRLAMELGEKEAKDPDRGNKRKR